MSTKQRAPLYTTEIGEAVYPHLTKADTRFDAGGVFHTKLKFDHDPQVTVKGEQVGSLLDLLNAEHQKVQAEAKKAKPGKKVKVASLPVEEGEDGSVSFNFKMKHHVKTKSGDEWYQEPKLFDAKGKKFKPEGGIYSGSKLRVAFTVHPFVSPIVGAGLTLRLHAVQVVELVQGSGGKADSYGFGEEDGYEAPDSSPFEASNDEAADGTDATDF